MTVKTTHYIIVLQDFLLSLSTTINNVEYGVIVDKVHNRISFNQSAWMKPYILCNNDLRKSVKHEFENHLLMSNSVFGKTMENVKHRIDLRLTTDPQMAVKQFSMLNFKLLNI